jgi:hypothetical protein
MMNQDFGAPQGADRVPAGPRVPGQQRREAQHPPVDGGVVDFDVALGEQLLDVAVGQGEAELPAHRKDDDVGREAEAGEGRRGDGSETGTASTHLESLPAPACSQ